jgi:hypothetical protein
VVTVIVQGRLADAIAKASSTLSVVPPISQMQPFRNLTLQRFGKVLAIRFIGDD